MARGSRYAELFQANPPFRFFWLSTLAGETGYAVYSITVVWLAIAISGQVAIAGIVLGIEYLVYALSFLVGPFVDRSRNLARLLQFGFPLQMLVAFAIGVLLILGWLTVPILLVLVVGLSILWNFTYVAQNSLLPRIVREDDLFRANGLVGAAGGVTQVAGFAAGGALLVLLGPAGGAFLYAGLNGAAGLLALPLSVPQLRARVTSVLEDFRAGWQRMFSPEGRPVLHLSVFSLAQAFFTTAPALIVAWLAHSVFAHPAEAYSILFTAFAIGGVFGGLLVGSANPRRGILTWLSAATVMEGALIATAVLVAPDLIGSAVVWLVVGVIDVIFFTICIAYLQATTPGGMFGRVMTNFYLFRGSSRAVGAVVLGFLAGALLPVDLGYLIAFGWMMIGVLGQLALPGLRRLAF
ncbi:MAG TPA: MFS transporter [Thermoplasmata archaeon]|nr:MFS transporter [Thermoplasmata archaeon]